MSRCVDYEDNIVRVAADYCWQRRLSILSGFQSHNDDAGRCGIRNRREEVFDSEKENFVKTKSDQLLIYRPFQKKSSRKLGWPVSLCSLVWSSQLETCIPSSQPSLRSIVFHVQPQWYNSLKSSSTISCSQPVVGTRGCRSINIAVPALTALASIDLREVTQRCRIVSSEVSLYSIVSKKTACSLTDEVIPKFIPPLKLLY